MIPLSEAFARALGHHRAGRTALAGQGYREILAVVPDHVETLHLWGLLAAQTGHGEAAVAAIGRALALRPDDPGILNSLGLALKAAGRVEEALVRYRQALALQPDNANAHNCLAVALQDQGQLAGAIGHYRQALACDPGLVDAAYNLGTALQRQGEDRQAEAQYRQVLAQSPDHAGAHNNLGNLLNARGAVDEALAHHRRATELAPNLPVAHYNLGTALQQRGRLDEAVAAYRRALALKPDYASAHANLGTALQGQGRLAEAVAEYRQTLALRPDGADAHYNLGTVFQQQGRVEDAAACHRRALALAPDHPKASFGLCIAQLPLVYRDEAEIQRCRAAYAGALEQLIARFGQGPVSAGLAEAVGASQPFYLPYQGGCDRALQQRYGALVCGIMARCTPPAPLPEPPGPGEPVRVGIVSGFFRDHSNWKIPIKGWLGQLDRRRFTLFGYHTGHRCDAETEVAASLCRRFVQGPLTLGAWRQTILADAPHVLIYPEVGMDPMAARLAAQRLARHQFNAWGHPETSGFPTLDYFLSSELMEPPDGDRHYTERLIRLPDLSLYYEPPVLSPVALDRSDVGFRPGATVFWCGQALFKYLPQYDGLFPRIARELGDCQFAFIGYVRGDDVTAAVRERLRQAFAACGLAADDFCVFLPTLSPQRFVAAIGLSDVVLDSIGWSGCNSTLEGLAHDLPIVTMPGPLMRGRHGLAILTAMGVTETIAGTLDDYVALAVRLARDPAWRQEVSRRIGLNKHRLYRNRAPIEALEAVLERVALDPQDIRVSKGPGPLAVCRRGVLMH
jgi:predicted O-linked N-acetylglucosamine transferase (SPINDLY family)